MSGSSKTGGQTLDKLKIGTLEILLADRSQNSFIKSNKNTWKLAEKEDHA